MDSLTKYALIAVGVLVALAGAFFALNAWEKRIDSAAYERGKNEVTAKFNAEGVKREEAERKKEHDRQLKTDEALNESEKRTQVAIADHVRSASAVRGLREQLDAERNKRPASSDPVIIIQRAATDKIGNLLANCAERYSTMASLADDARNRGQLCEAQYDALK